MCASVTVIFTCHNRKDITMKCIESIYDENLKMKFIVTDDSSTDGTSDAIRRFSEDRGADVKLIEGDGSLFWAGGMRKAIEAYLSEDQKTDYIILVNDDVIFNKDVISYMIDMCIKKNGAVIVGATCGTDGRMTYGAVKYKKNTVICSLIPPEMSNSEMADTFSCNCTLFTDEVLSIAGNFDEHYTHSLADFDYGFRIRKMGVSIFGTDRYVGTCDDNPVTGSWRDTTLKRAERLKKKEESKGLPFKEWFYYLNKNFGIWTAIWHSLTPYIRILAGK